jgi:uncharacterized protein (DUF983 family)
VADGDGVKTRSPESPSPSPESLSPESPPPESQTPVSRPTVGLWHAIVLVVRAARLRCPACGRGRIFFGWFTMHDACPDCGRSFQRGPGFFLGSIYFNYFVTALLVPVVYFAVFFADLLTDRQLLALTLALALGFPVWFFRYARALWLAFDELWDPADRNCG